MVAAPEAAAWTYEVTVAPTLDLDVVGTFAGPLVSDLFVDESAAAFVEGFAVFDGGAFRSIGQHDARVRDLCRTTCRVRYRFRLRAAAVALATADVAILAGDAIFAPPSTWLLHPEPGAASNERYRFHVGVPPGVRFVTGVHPVPAAPDTYEASSRTFDESTFSAFGALRTVRIPGSPAEVAVAPGVALSDHAVAGWLGSEVHAITAYLGHFPEDRVVLFVAPGTGEVMRGETLGGGGASVLLRVGTGITEASLVEDWVAAHELLHVGFPSLERRHAWLYEGLASYVEPLARVRVGIISKEKVWKDLVEGLPQGLPASGDHGLETDRSWGRVYWGGSLYWLLADIGIRKSTENARSLDDVLRTIAATGANVETMWPVERVLDEGDRVTGTRVLHDVYDRLARAPGTEDLPALWLRLGVRLDGQGVHFDDGAPWAAIRTAIAARRADTGNPRAASLSTPVGRRLPRLPNVTVAEPAP